MIEGLRPYAESAAMKPMTRTSEINIPWLTTIPEHWRVVRSKGLFTVRTERARSDDEQLSATQAYGVIPQKDFENRIGRKVVRITQHLEKRAHVEPDDFVISMRSFQGGLERAWARGCIRSSYVVLKPSPETQVGYFAHLFKSLDYIRALQATSNFIRDGQDLNFDNFSLVDLPLPPLNEQAAIAKCLDHVNQKIDGFIRTKRKLIGLLNEQKQAIIHRAVTRGLNPDVPFKPSGIPCVGEIPTHWETPLNRQLFRENIRQHNGKTERQLSLSQRDGLIATDDMKERSLQTSSFDNWKVTIPSDLVLNRFKAHLGVFFASTLRGIVSFHYGVFEPQRLLNTKYFELLYHTGPYKVIYAGRSNGMTVGLQNLSNQNFYGVRSIVPPLNEQNEIVTYAETATAKLNTAIARTEREITLIQEYRTRLTTDVVTGRLDARAAAAKLPDLNPGATLEPIADEVLDEIETEES